MKYVDQCSDTLFSPQYGNNVVFIKLFSEFVFALNMNSVFIPFDHINVWFSDAQIEPFFIRLVK